MKTIDTGRSPLIKTKMSPPRSVKSEIEREQIKQVFETLGAHSLCIVASAGSGKSTALRQLHQAFSASGYRTGWLNIDTRDNDPSTFVPYLFDVIETLGEVQTGSSHIAIDFEDPKALKEAFSNLERLLLKLPNHCVLIFDDFHHIKNPDLLEHLNHLVDVCNGHCQLVIASRELPKLNIPNRILSNQFASLPNDLLRFTNDESEQFFRDRGAKNLSRVDVESLSQAVEGWAAGLQFAAISIEHADGQKLDYKALPQGNERLLSQYLASDVLQTQTEELQNFLLKTAPLKQFNASLCRYVSGFANAEEMIAQLIDKNLFVITLTADGTWFRYHHLFADFLTRELQRQYPEGLNSVRLSAAQWCVENSMLDEAINYLLDCENYEHAADLIAMTAMEEALNRGDLAKVLRWIGSLPKRFRQHHPSIILAYSVALGFARGVKEAQTLLEDLLVDLKAENTPWKMSNEETSDYICFAEVIKMLFFATEERGKDIAADAERWRQDWPNAAPLYKASMCQITAYTHMIHNRFNQAVTMATEGRRIALQANAPYVWIWSDCVSAMTHIASGDPSTALAFINRANVDVEEHMAEKTQLKLMVPLLSARAAYEMGQFNEAFLNLSRGREFAATFGPLEPLIDSYRLQAQKERYDGDLNTGVAILEQGLTVGLTNDLPRLSIAMIAELVTFLGEMNQTKRAKQLCEQWGISDGTWRMHFDNDSPILNNNVKRIEMETALLAQDYNRVIVLSQSALHNLRNYARPRSLIRIGILKTIALVAKGETQRGWREMSDIIRRARPNCLVSSFHELRHLCLPIIENIIAYRNLNSGAGSIPIESPEDWIFKVLQGQYPLDTSVNNEPEIKKSKDLIEELTRRELDMLILVARGCSNSQIADELLVSTATVKWHLYNAFQKMGVKNRIAAVSRARELGLIDS